MNGNNIQPNTNYNPAFTPNTAPVANQQAVNPQAGPVPPLGNALDLSSNPSARNLQNYSAVAGEPDPFNLPEYQPIQPGEPYMEKLADEAENTKRIERFLKHAQACEADGDFKDAEESYEKALKYTEDAEHYKLYASCLSKLSASLKDEAQERVYKEKAAKAFYYLGGLYEKQEAWNPAQTAYKVSCELAPHEIPLQALVAVARQLGEKGDIVDALEKLADFYARKGDTASAIQMLEEALQVEKSSKILEKLATLHAQVGGEDSQLKVNETRIQQFELQISKNPESIGVYRKYAWFLKDIGRKSEARAVKERMDIAERKERRKINVKFQLMKAHEYVERLSRERLNEQVGFLPVIEAAALITLLSDSNSDLRSVNLQGCVHITDAVLDLIVEKFKGLEELNLSGCKAITEAGLSSIVEKASELKRLGLDECPATSIKFLHRLNAKGIAFSIKGLSFRKNILDLSARRNYLTDSELLKALEANPEITELCLANCINITDAGVALLKNFQWLTSLNLYYCRQLTDASLQHLKGRTQLTSLNLTCCQQLTDGILQHLKSLTQLTSLNLSYCQQLTDGRLQYLKGLSNLTSLNLSYCQQLTGEGLQDLAGLTQLTGLDLIGCNQISSNGKEQLKRQIPGLTING